MNARLRRARWYIDVNGPLWFLVWAGTSVLRSVAVRSEQILIAMEEHRHLQGANAVALNRATWNSYDWARHGEEWTVSPAWKASLIASVLQPFVPGGSAVLEIGPGAGRWTEVIHARASRLILADISEVCLEQCRTRFSDWKNVEYHLSDGRSLPFIADESLDRIWSFDVFVHIAPADVAFYASEFARVLRPGGQGLIHHANWKPGETGMSGGSGMIGGYRSRLTAEVMADLLHAHGLVVLDQFDSWGDNRARHDVKAHGDILTRFGKPGD